MTSNTPSNPTIATLPRCILVNGPSSSGKTTIVKALQDRLPVVMLGFGIDAILYGLPPSDLASMIAGRDITRREYDYDRLVDAHHAAARALLETGCRVILDTGLLCQAHRTSFETAVRGFDTFRIGVTCHLAELDRRELTRGDRAVGSARWEADIVHQGMSYDLMLDTTKTGVDDHVNRVLETIAKRVWS